MGATTLRSRPFAVRLWIAVLTLPALASFARGAHHLVTATPHQWGVLASLIVSGLAAGEAGRLVEGRRRHDTGRLSKCLTAFPFAAALCCPPGFNALVIVPLYVHTRRRGLVVPLWKWIGSADILILSAGLVRIVRDVFAVGSPWHQTLPTGPIALLGLAGAVALMIGGETLLFAVCAYANDEQDELDLRAALTSRSFFSGELMVCVIGAISAALANTSAWALLAVLPVWVTVQRAAAQPALQQRADIDARTGLLTFAAWNELATDQLAERRTSQGVAVVLLDLDHFKRVNDERGHLEGDAVLARVAARMRKELRPGDLLGRFGGEEFCLLVADVTPGQAHDVAERVRRAAKTPPELAAAGGAVVSASAGVTWTRCLTQVESMLREADAALYDAKGAGRDTLRVAIPADAVEQLVPSQREAPVLTRQPADAA